MSDEPIFLALPLPVFALSVSLCRIGIGPRAHASAVFARAPKNPSISRARGPFEQVDVVQVRSFSLSPSPSLWEISQNVNVPLCMRAPVSLLLPGFRVRWRRKSLASLWTLICPKRGVSSACHIFRSQGDSDARETL